MRFCLSILCLFFAITASLTAQPQAVTLQAPSTFQQQAQVATSGGKTFRVVNLTATAEWIAGSDRESGTAQLQANTDGSATVQLSLGKATRTEIQSALDSRKCSWTDNAGKSHDVLGPNCLIAIPWFSPSLFTQPPARLSVLLGTADNGVASAQGVAAHQINYSLQLTGTDPSVTQLADLSTVKVFYDPKTALPVSLEYFIHPDNDDSKNIPVNVVFSNYKPVSGLMLPFHIEKSINHTLQLKLDVSNASVE